MVGTILKVMAWRKASYVVTAVTIVLLYSLLQNYAWHGSLEFLTSVEWIATMMSLCVGALSLVRFYSQREITFLFIGSGFIVNGLLTGGHAAILSAYFINAFTASSLIHLAWSLYASRLFFPVLIWLSWFFWRQEQRHGTNPAITDRLVYWMVGATAFVLFILFDVGPLRSGLPHHISLDFTIESLPGIFYLLALVGYYRKGKWRTDPFEYWLILGIIVGVMGEVLLLPYSHMGSSVIFALVQMLKVVGSLCAFIGLLFNLRRLFSESLVHQELLRKNVILNTQQEASQDAILIVNEDDVIISYNTRFIELFSIPGELLMQGDDEPVLKFVTEQVANPEEFVARIKYLYEHRAKTSIDEVYLKDGTIIDRYSAPLNGGNGKYYGRAWYFRDVTAKQHNEQLMRESEEKYRGLIEQSLVGIAMIEEGRFSYVNGKFTEIFGYSADEMMSLAPGETALSEDRAMLEAVMRDRLASDGEGEAFTFRGRHKDGNKLFIEGRCARMNFGGKLGLMMIIMDITERVRAENEVQSLQVKLREQAIRDPLTGLFNRRYLDEVISSEMARAERGGYPMSFIMCDIDHFKVINDKYGHLAGDEVLRAFSRLIKHYSRGGDIICRYGGEEFLLVLPGMTREGAVARAEQLRQAFAAALMSYNATIIRATASFGVATYQEDGHDIDKLIGAADKALYLAKESGRNQVRESAA